MKRLLLILSSLVLFQTALQAQQVKEMYLYAVKGTDSLFVDRHVDWSRIRGDKIPTMIYMYGGGWAFGGYNTHEIQTFVEKFVLQGLKLEMKTEEYNLEESSHLPGFKPVHSKNPDAEGMPNPNPPAQRP